MATEMDVQVLTWGDVHVAAEHVAARWRQSVGSGAIEHVYGVPRGGHVPAALVASLLGVPQVDQPTVGTLVVDDLVDSGTTAQRYLAGAFRFDALFRKGRPGPAPRAIDLGDAWVVFPWELDTPDAHGPADAVVRLLEHIGEDPRREGLIDTPQRVLKALSEMTAGYAEDPVDVLGTTFDVPFDELVAVTGVEFVSLCEHHMLPFTGTACIGYLPGDRVVGLSKLARIVDTFARRLQVQERMTNQIAEAISDVLKPRGVAVVVSGQHSCMSCRGVRKHGTMVTSAMLGRFRESDALRAEFMALATKA